MAETPEYATIRRRAEDFRLAVQNDLPKIALLLQGTDPMLLTPGNVDTVTNQAHTPGDRALSLVRFVQTKVQSDTKFYTILIDALKTDALYYKSILEKLEKTLQEELEKKKENGGGSAPKQEYIPEIYLKNSDMVELLQLLRPVAAQWEDIAICLNPPLSEGAAASIKYDNSGKPDRAKHCLREMLSKWLKRINPCRPSWQTLRAAVKNADIDGGDGIVSKIDEKIAQKAHQ